MEGHKYYSIYLQSKEHQHSYIDWLWCTGKGCNRYKDVLFMLPKDILKFLIKELLKNHSFTDLCLISKRFTPILFEFVYINRKSFKKILDKILKKQKYRKPNWNSNIWQLYGFNEANQMIKSMIHKSNKREYILLEAIDKCWTKNGAYVHTYLSCLDVLTNRRCVFRALVRLIKCVNPQRDWKNVILLMKKLGYFEEILLTQIPIIEKDFYEFDGVFSKKMLD